MAQQNKSQPSPAPSSCRALRNFGEIHLDLLKCKDMLNALGPLLDPDLITKVSTYGIQDLLGHVERKMEHLAEEIDRYAMS